MFSIDIFPLIEETRTKEALELIAYPNFDPDVQKEWEDEIHEAAIISACEYGNIDIVPALIKKDADVNGTYDKILSDATDCSSTEDINKQIREKTAINEKDRYDVDTRTKLPIWLDKPLFDIEIAKLGNIEDAQKAITEGADIYQKDEYGKTALHYSAMNGHLEFAKWWVDSFHKSNVMKDLITGEANEEIKIDREDNYGKTALHYSAWNGHLNVVIWLVLKGADIHKKDSYGKTALHYAAWNGCLEVAKWLVSQRANNNEQDNEKQTVLHVATKKKHIEFVKWLISIGTDIDKKDDKGMTSFNRRHLDFPKLLISNGIELSNHIESSCSIENNRKLLNNLKESYGKVKDTINTYIPYVCELMKVIKNKDVRNMFSLSKKMRFSQHKDEILNTSHFINQSSQKPSPLESLPKEIQNNIAFLLSEISPGSVQGKYTSSLIREPNRIIQTNIQDSLFYYKVDKTRAKMLAQYMSSEKTDALKIAYISEYSMNSTNQNNNKLNSRILTSKDRKRKASSIISESFNQDLKKKDFSR